MEEEAASTIIRGTLITSGVSAFVTGLYGIASRNPNYGFLATAAAVNSGVTAVTFFGEHRAKELLVTAAELSKHLGLREFIISPLLVYSLPWPQYVRRRQAMDFAKTQDSVPLTQEPTTLADLRRYKTLDSGLSGALAGGLLRGWKSGRRAVVPGGLTFGALCTLLQLGYNELIVIRLKYLSDLNDGLSPKPVTSSVEKLSSGRLFEFLGFQSVSDEEYLRKLKVKREEYLKKIAELEHQLTVEKQEKK